MKIACFWLEPTEVNLSYLRRYSSGWGDCPVHGYHNAMLFLDRRPIVLTSDGYIDSSAEHPKDDPRWPTACGCGYVFADGDAKQLHTEQLFRRLDNGEEMTLRDAPVGALWSAWWLADIPSYRGPDGVCLMVKTPGGEWHVDGRANNCTLKDDDVHKCWVRHGDPRDPLGLQTGQPLHVDKNGNTCAAGAGSILQPTYHGFLHHGHLVQC